VGPARYLIRDGNSLGYDFRDFEAVLAFAAAHANDSLYIYTRASNIELFAATLAGDQVSYIGYPKREPAFERLATLSARLGVEPANSLSFRALHAAVQNRPKLPSGYLLPSADGYLRSIPALVDRYHAQLVELAAEYSAQRVVFAVVSGLKPESELGADHSARAEEGRRQTFPLSSVVRVVGQVQRALQPLGVAFVPLYVQYGSRNDVLSQLAEANRSSDLCSPLRLLLDVDWDSQPQQQAACYSAIQRYSRERKLPAVALGNASTYQHLILGAVGGFDAMAVALHGYEVAHAGDGRAYWDELSRALPFLRTFRQECPGVWDGVASAMDAYLKRTVLERLK